MPFGAENDPATGPCEDAAPADLDDADRQFLLGLARRALRESVGTGRGLPEIDPEGLGPKLTAPRGCFVTLTCGGELRGCIGNIMPGAPLYRAVMANARSAALEDGRFSPVHAGEVEALTIEISVLTEPRPLAYSSPDDLLRKLRAGEDGVVLRFGGGGATFLPQVWEQLPDKETFLGHLSLKAGGGREAWRHPGTTVLVYRVEHFGEAERSGQP